jgi:hypothetical protein
MSDAIAALLPPVVMAALFVALVVTALRATDWAAGTKEVTPPPDSTGSAVPPGEEPRPEPESDHGKAN